MRQRLIVSARKAGVSAVLAAVLSQGIVVPLAFAEDAVVESLIQRGIQLRRDGQDEQAINVFLDAERQEPRSVRVLLHILTAAQAAGRWLMADAYMQKVSALKDDPYYQRHEEAIEVVRRAIASRVGSFQVQGSPAGALVQLDGRTVATLPMVTPTSVEAGSYVMEVKSPGFYRLRRNVTITGGVLTREPVELNRIPPPKEEVAGGPGVGGGAQAYGAVVPEERSWWSSPAVGWSLFGVGVASGVLSGIAFGMREDRAETWNSEDECIPSTGQTREEVCGNFKDDAETYQTLGVVTAVAGVAFVGTGLTLLLFGDSDRASDASRLQGTADGGGLELTSCGPGLMSLACRGTF